MSNPSQWAVHRVFAFVRFYVAMSPQAAEELWQTLHQFEQRPSFGSGPTRWYRFAGQTDLVEIGEDRSGEWHADGKLPEGVDPNSVVEIPKIEPVPTVLDNLMFVLRQIPADAPNREQTAEMIQMITELGAPETAARLAKNLQSRLTEIPGVAEEQIRFLEQVSERMLRAEMHEGKVRGLDVAGLLTVREIARTVAWVNPLGCAALLRDAAKLTLSEIGDMARQMIGACWRAGLRVQVEQALDWLRGQGEKTIEMARMGMYPEGEPELLLEIYYGTLLKSLPYLLAAFKGYHELSVMPNLSEDDRETFAHKSGTAEEKAVRMLTALHFAVMDVDGSRLAEQQAFVQSLLQVDRKRAGRLVYELVDLQFFYPPAYTALLMGDGAATSA
jgi:hypothetical protein